MKRLMLHSMFAAAAVTALAASGFAQSLTAEIPFAFRANGVLMAPGSYELNTNISNTVTIVSFYNRDNHSAAMVANLSLRDAPKAWVKAATPRLSFECAAERCALREIWTGHETSYVLPAPKHHADEPVQITEIRLNRTSAP